MTSRRATASVDKRVSPLPPMMASMESAVERQIVALAGHRRAAGGRRTGAAQKERASCYFARPWFYLSIHDIVKTSAGAGAGLWPDFTFCTGHRHVPRPIVQDDGGETGLGPVHLLRRADQHQDQRRGLPDRHPADGRRNRAPDCLWADDQGSGARIRKRDG